MDYIVTCDEGVRCQLNGFNGGEIVTLGRGQAITQSDVDMGRFAPSVLAHLESVGKLERVGGQLDKEEKEVKKDKALKGLKTK